MRASNLTIPFLTKVEKENIQAMAIHRNYKKYLELAQGSKKDYLWCKALPRIREDESRLEEMIKMFKKDAIEYWEKSQKYLAEYNEFEKNRKYPNK